MLITRTSMVSGVTRTMDLPITEEQIQAYEVGGLMLQHAFSNLTPDQREFYRTGITTDEWEELFDEE